MSCEPDFDPDGTADLDENEATEGCDECGATDVQLYSVGLREVCEGCRDEIEAEEADVFTENELLLDDEDDDFLGSDLPF